MQSKVPLETWLLLEYRLFLMRSPHYSSQPCSTGCHFVHQTITQTISPYKMRDYITINCQFWLYWRNDVCRSISLEITCTDSPFSSAAEYECHLFPNPTSSCRASDTYIKQEPDEHTQPAQRRQYQREPPPRELQRREDAQRGRTYDYTAASTSRLNGNRTPEQFNDHTRQPPTHHLKREPPRDYTGWNW